MEIFEIHITGDEKIIEAGGNLGIKTIVIDLVKPDKSYYRTEHMTSHVHHARNYDECKTYVDELVDKLITLGVQIKRVKIECPFYQGYVNRSLYFEIHYDSEDNKYPLSQNRGKDTYLCTVRTYEKKEYYVLLYKYARDPKPNQVMELCLHDTDVNEDKDWFDLYGQETREIAD